jgi:hypothetical protein
MARGRRGGGADMCEHCSPLASRITRDANVLKGANWMSKYPCKDNLIWLLNILAGTNKCSICCSMHEYIILMFHFAHRTCPQCPGDHAYIYISIYCSQKRIQKQRACAYKRRGFFSQSFSGEKKVELMMI